MNVEESPDSNRDGMERKLRLAIAGFQTLYPYVEFETGFELTKLESNRDERK